MLPRCTGPRCTPIEVLESSVEELTNWFEIALISRRGSFAQGRFSLLDPCSWGSPVELPVRSAG